MPAPEYDKAYVKKHKINDLLNDLFTSITQAKPENPIEYAFKYFQEKMPPPPAPPKPSSLLDFKVTQITSMDQPDNSGNLLAQLLNRNKQTSLDGSKGNISISHSGVAALSAVNKVTRSVRKKKEETLDDLIESEKVTIYKEASEDKEYEKYDKPLENVRISYKNDLKNREMIKQHKMELRGLILAEKYKFDERTESTDQGLTRSEASQPIEKAEAEVEEEILTADNYNAVLHKRPKNKLKRDKTFTKESVNRQSFGNAQFAPVVKLVICQSCSKVQANEDDDLKDEKKIDARPLKEQNKVIDSIQMEPLKEEPTADDPLKNNFLELIKKSTEAPQTPKEDNFDDENIESASQVSGPRPMMNYEAETARTKQSEIQYPKDTSVLAWIMSRQNLDDSKVKKEGSQVSRASAKTLTPEPTKPTSSPASKPASRPTSRVSDRSNQRWNFLDSSNSDLSLTKNNKKN